MGEWTIHITFSENIGTHNECEGNDIEEKRNKIGNALGRSEKRNKKDENKRGKKENHKEESAN
jgi:hypothetical protein